MRVWEYGSMGVGSVGVLKALCFKPYALSLKHLSWNTDNWAGRD
jgi:hypothetical protein